MPLIQLFIDNLIQPMMPFMLEGIFQTFGGLGLFLLGMIIMTDGLRRLTGRYLRNTLTRFTHSPASGAVTGALSTAVLQSSSATTVAAIGFVGAGLLTFPQSLGIIFGANIGTTMTGWLVALLGFEFKLGTMVLPLIFIGVLLRLFSRGQLAASGLALAGFGLIFVGISQLQFGMEGMQGLVTPDSFPDDSWSGRLQLVAIGIAITLVTQSSSAGVAAAITAVYTGTVTFPQAAALVIGMDVGTTVTAVIATIGGSLESRRTGFSHVIYNLFTGVVALLLLTPYVWFWQNNFSVALSEHAEIALVAFHTSFNLVGVILVLFFTNAFARLIEYIFPGKPDPAVWRLDGLLLKEPDSALQAIRLTLNDLIKDGFRYTQQMLSPENEHDKTQLDDQHNRLEQTHRYIDELHLNPEDKKRHKELVVSIHAMDHLLRLQERCDEDEERITVATTNSILKSESKILSGAINATLQAMEANDWVRASQAIDDVSAYFRVETPGIREQLMRDVASGQIDIPEGVDRLEAIRSLKRISDHMSRIVFHARTLAESASS